MLLSLALDPACFGPSAITDVLRRFAAEAVLRAVFENAVIVSDDVDKQLREMIAAVQSLPSPLGQQIGILVAEIAKNKKRFFASLPPESPLDGSATDRLRRSALRMGVDIVICKDATNAEEMSDVADRGVEVCALAEFLASRSEVVRRSWLQAQRLDNNPDDKAVALIVGRVVRYERTITVADGMFGRQAKDDRWRQKLKWSVGGIIYLARVWRDLSPYQGKIDVEIITVAGATGASGGFVDPVQAAQRIRSALVGADKECLIGSVTVTMKQDSEPKVLRDRYVVARRRCWGIKHGMDDLGKLAVGGSKRSPTLIEPHSDGALKSIAELRQLPDAGAQSGVP